MEYNEKEKNGRRYKSLFWPMFLIGVGTAWLLVNIGVFTAENIAVAVQLWPLLLVAIGVDLLFGRKSATRGATIGLIFVGFILAIMYIGPSMGLGVVAERTNTTFDLPLDGAESFNLDIKAGIDNIVVKPLVDSNDLIQADIWHFGDLDIDVSDDTAAKTVSIKQQAMGFNFSMLHGDETTNWTFNINPRVPLAISLDGGVGETNLDLSQFDLTNLELHTGVGAFNMSLPTPQHSYLVDINGGIGEVVVDIPDDAAIQVIASTGIGNADLPSNLTQVTGEDGLLGESGTWQTPGFETAEKTITIQFNGGIGSLKID